MTSSYDVTLPGMTSLAAMMMMTMVWRGAAAAAAAAAAGRCVLPPSAVVDWKPLHTGTAAAMTPAGRGPSNVAKVPSVATVPTVSCPAVSLPTLLDRQPTSSAMHDAMPSL